MFLSQTKAAGLSDTVVSGRSFQNGPFYLVFHALCFEFPDIFRKARLVVCRVHKRFLVYCKSLLECWLAGSYVMFAGVVVINGYLCVVHDVPLVTFPVERAVVTFVSGAIAVPFAWVSFTGNLLVVFLDGLSYIVKAPVAYLDIVLIKDFVVCMVLWEVLLYKVQYGFCNLRFNILTIWRIKPYNFALAGSFLFGRAVRVFGFYIWAIYNFLLVSISF